MSHRYCRDEIAELLAYKEQAGLTYRELGEETGINRHTLAHWAWRLKAEGRSADDIGFVEVVVADEIDEETTIEIVLSPTRAVRVRRGFDEETLRRVLCILIDSC